MVDIREKARLDREHTLKVIKQQKEIEVAKRLQQEQEANKEMWKYIPDFPNYQLSNRGRLRVINYIKPYEDRYFLSKDGKKYHFSIRQLLAKVFK